MTDEKREQTRVLVTGSRDWTDEAAIRRVLSNLPPDTVLCHGAARGADTLAAKVAEEFGFEVVAYPADWERDGRAAGPIRNQRMLNEFKPTRVIAFPLGPSVIARCQKRKRCKAGCSFIRLVRGLESLAPGGRPGLPLLTTSHFVDLQLGQL